MMFAGCKAKKGVRALFPLETFDADGGLFLLLFLSRREEANHNAFAEMR